VRGSAELAPLEAEELCVFGKLQSAFPLAIAFAVFVAIVPRSLRRSRAPLATAVCLSLGAIASLLNWIFFRSPCSL
jgi:hypothetical protein